MGTLATLVEKHGPRYLLLYGGSLLLAFLIGAAIAYAQSFLGDNYAYVLIGVLLVAVVVLAILWEWRIGVLMLPATLPYENALNLGPLASGIKALAMLTFFSLALGLLRERRQFQRFVRLWQEPLTLAVFVFVLWCLVSVLWASYPDAAATRTVTFLGVLGLMVSIGMLETRWLYLLWAVTTLSVIVSVPAGPSLPPYRIQGDGSTSDPAKFSSGLQPNDYAGLLVVVFMVAYFGLGQRYRMIAYIAPVVFIGIFASQSRTGLLALVAAPVLAFFIPRLRTRLVLRTLLMYGLATAALIGIILVVPSVGEMVTQRYSTLAQVGSSETWSGRLATWQGAAKVIASHPILGVGAGNFPYFAIDYSDVVVRHAARKGEGSGVAHNMLLGVGAELGLVGLILFLGILFFAFKLALSLSRRSLLGAGVLLGLLAYTIMGMTAEWEYEKIGYVVFGSLLSLQLQQESQRAESDRENSP